MAEDLMPQSEFPRPLTAHERATLDFMLSVDDDRLTPLREQAKRATALGRCACPCATIDLAVDQSAGSRMDDVPDFDINSNTAAVSDDRADSYFLILFVRDGWLSSLEIAYIFNPPTEFPPIEAWEPPRVSDRAAGDASASGPRTRAWSTLRRLLGRPAPPSGS